jgi:ferredoxin-thioredoxin reductase catalytic chain
VSGRVLDGEARVESIPERRPFEMPEEKKPEPSSPEGEITVWRCKVCGYLCARKNPPEICPICKVGRERFEPFPWNKSP